MKILAIDQSSTISGICRIFVDDEMEPHYDIKQFRTDDLPTEAAKLIAWDKFMTEELARECRYVFIERPITPQGPAAARSIILHKIAGIIELACVKRPEVIFKQIVSTRLKKWAGSTNKQTVMLLARDVWQESIIDDNTADAAWLGHIAYHVALSVEPDNQARREVLKELLKSEHQVTTERLAARRLKSARKTARELKAAA
jgi:hypothetical protein